MTVGARIRSEGGSLVQIDPLYENLAMRATGTLTTSQLGSSGAAANCGIASLQLAGCNEPVLAVSCPDAFVGLRQRTQNGGTYQWELITSVPVVNVRYWVFDTTDAAQMAFLLRKGLRIRNPTSGRVVFDSRYKYMRITGVVTVEASTSESSTAVTPASGYAIGLAQSGAVTIAVAGPVSGSDYWLQNISAYVTGFKTANGSVLTKGINTATVVNDGNGVPPASGTFGSWQTTGLVLDVRNY